MVILQTKKYKKDSHYMNSKQNRISEISHIIKSEVVRSQQDIISRLSERGIEVTQASLSRYLKEIQASRIPDGVGGYIYKLPDETEMTQGAGIASEIIRSERFWPHTPRQANNAVKNNTGFFIRAYCRVSWPGVPGVSGQELQKPVSRGNGCSEAL